MGGVGPYSPAQSPPRCTKCNSPSINGQCTSPYNGPLLCGFNVPIKYGQKTSQCNYAVTLHPSADRTVSAVIRVYARTTRTC